MPNKKLLTPLSNKEIVINSENDAVILALESSCDETACAIVKNGREVLANIVASQIKTHMQFGGVVPEVAAREHLEAVNEVISKAFDEAKVSPDEITAVASTVGPGLVGSLLVGMNAAKTLSVVYDKPFIGVNHLNAHVCANYIDTDLKPPFIALLVSGGHTQIIRVNDYSDSVILGETIDDAAGEAFDKVARLLGLAYPGGPNLDKMADKGNPHAYKFTKAKTDEFDFSFSGLKTAVLQLTKKLSAENPDYPKEDVAASFRENITSVLAEKTLKAAQKFGVKQIVLAGGVAANSEIRRKIKGFENQGYKIYIPAMKYCTDNAAMIGACAYFHDNVFTDLSTEVFSRA
ncbi:MAG: tRNA (adenosine(37)-N6)-threonylcarbamoyltransferase complex transferase subunit TsaD [Candidatus Gastranaerophilales bacterium]|nr:tRNA (adenosine(37)-N6)-threonylcarbamoyltransferase complex transferase subunit TsaD [Candidatus Gastranaerophilales bacterium]